LKTLCRHARCTFASVTLKSKQELSRAPDFESCSRSLNREHAKGMAQALPFRQIGRRSATSGGLFAWGATQERASGADIPQPWKAL
jgi:hypothetical protein